MTRELQGAKEKYPWLNRIFGSLFNRISGAGMTGAEMQAHDLNVAETMRQERRQEDFYNQYQSIGAQVRQMQEAGINPAVAAGGLQAPSPASGLSASPASAAPGGDPLSFVLSTIEGIRGLKAQNQEIALRAAEEKREQEEHQRKMRLLDQDIWRKDFDNAHYEEVYTTNREQQLAAIDKLRSDIRNVDEHTLYTATQRNKTEIEADILSYQRFMSAIDADSHEKIVNAQLAYTEAQTKLLSATTERERKTLQKLSAEIANLDADTAKKVIEKTKLSTETKKLAIEALVLHRTQDVLVEQAFADLAKTDAEAARTAVDAVHNVRPGSSFDIERGKNEVKRAVRNATEAARLSRTAK